MSAPTILHHRVIPTSSSDTYTPNQTVDFHLQVPGRKLINNSVRIEGTVTVFRSDGTTIITQADNIKLDAFTGAHAFIAQMSSEVESKGMIETLNNYPRYVAVSAKASMSPDDTLSMKMQAEMRCGGRSDNGKYALQRVITRSESQAGTAPALTDSEPASFSIKPMCAINRASGNDYSFDRLGFMRLSLILAQNRDAIFGFDSTTLAGAVNLRKPCTYKLSNLALRFSTVPEDGDSSPALYRSYFSTVNSVSSTASSFVSRVPSKRVNGVTCVFIKQSDARAFDQNSQALQVVPQFDSTEFLFANSVSSGIEYRITDDHEAIERGIQSLSSTGHSNVSVQTLQGNDGYVIGYNFDSYMDLSQQLFSQRLVLGSTTITTNPLDCTSYFGSLLEM